MSNSLDPGLGPTCSQRSSPDDTNYMIICLPYLWVVRLASEVDSWVGRHTHHIVGNWLKHEQHYMCK